VSTSRAELIERGWLDGDGYPTDAALGKIKDWPHDGERGWDPLLCFVEDLWRYDHYFWRDGGFTFMATGGWSGNEDLVGALQSNLAFWGMEWRLSRVGGLHAFKSMSAAARLRAAAARFRAAAGSDGEEHDDALRELLAAAGEVD
jgi:hypothetical protein